MKNTIIVVAIFTIVIIAALVVFGFWMNNKIEKLDQKNPAVENAKKTTAETASEPVPQKAMKKGIIEGSLSYPSEGIPEMRVCAENIINKDLVCTTDRIQNKKYTYGTGYKLEAPAGTYRVYASLIDPQGIRAGSGANYRAYYSEFVTCGLSYGCPSHAPINVPVEENQTVSNIDPIDWYNN